MAARKSKKQAGGSAAPDWGQINKEDIKEFFKIQEDAEELRHRPHTFADVANLTARLSKAANNVGGYYLAVPEGLLYAGKGYYLEHADRIREELKKGGADDETTNAVIDDYAAALCGLFDFKATPEQMQRALNACQPLTGYAIDKYGFFIGLLYCYKRNINTLAEYTLRVKQEPDAAQREQYFISTVSAGDYTDLRAAALLWLINIGYVTAADFAGVSQGTISVFLKYANLYGLNGRFVTYVYIARRALNASGEYLLELNPPPLFYTQPTENPIITALNYADVIAAETDLYLDRIAEQVEAVLAAPTPEETTRAKEQAQQAASQIITIPENYALLSSRNLWAAQDATKDGQKVKEILPIEDVINDYLERNPAAATTTPYMIQKAIEGVNLLQQLKHVEPLNGIFTFETNLTEFSNLCGYDDAPEPIKKQLFTALRVIDGVFTVVYKPKGPVAQRILTVETLGLGGQETGRLRFHVYASGLNGRPKLISSAELEEMKKDEKGAAKLHFRGQIMAKGYRNEPGLINEVFGFEDKIIKAQATQDAEQIKAAEEYARKERPHARKKLKKWFDDWQQRGIISYQTKTNKKGETVYYWKRLKPPTPEELAELRPTLEQIEEREKGKQKKR